MSPQVLFISSTFERLRATARPLSKIRISAGNDGIHRYLNLLDQLATTTDLLLDKGVPRFGQIIGKPSPSLRSRHNLQRGIQQLHP